MKSIFMRSADAIRMLGAPITPKQLKELTGRQKEEGDYHVRFTPGDVKSAAIALDKDCCADCRDVVVPPVVFLFASSLVPAGTSSIAANAAYLMAKQGERILAIDCDPQGQMTSLLDADALIERSLFDVLAQKATWRQSTVSLYDNATLDIVGSSVSQNFYQHNQLIDVYRSALLQPWYDLKADATGRYDAIVIDAGNSQIPLCAAASHIADAVITVVALQDPLSISTGQITLSRNMCAAESTHILVANHFDPGNKQCKENLAALKASYPALLCKQTIPDYSGFGRQTKRSSQTFLLAEEEPNTSAVSAMLALSRELLGRVTKGRRETV